MSEKLQQHLSKLYEYYADVLPDPTWPLESDRWTELAFCLLHQASDGVDTAATRDAAALLQYLQLLDIARLADKQTRDTDAAAALRVLSAHGFSDAAARAGWASILAAAEALAAKHDGKVQVFLNRHGSAMAAELADLFRGAPLAESHLRDAVTMWLQNVVNMPLTLSTPQISRMLKAFGATENDLLIAADGAGLNLAVVDDLAAMAEGDAGFQAWLEQPDIRGAAQPERARHGG